MLLLLAFSSVFSTLQSNCFFTESIIPLVALKFSSQLLFISSFICWHDNNSTWSSLCSFQPHSCTKKPSLAPSSPQPGWRRVTASPCCAASHQLCSPSSRMSAGSETVITVLHTQCGLFTKMLHVVLLHLLLLSRCTAASVQQRGHWNLWQQVHHHFKGCIQGAWRCVQCQTEDQGWNQRDCSFCLHLWWEKRLFILVSVLKIYRSA